MDTKFLIIIIVFILINVIAFIAMLIDKIKSAKNGSERISEGMLFFMAAALGGLGIYAGMFACHHKTRKWYFMLGIPLLILQNFAVIYLICSSVYLLN